MMLAVIVAKLLALVSSLTVGEVVFSHVLATWSVGSRVLRSDEETPGLTARGGIRAS